MRNLMTGKPLTADMCSSEAWSERVRACEIIDQEARRFLDEALAGRRLRAGLTGSVAAFATLIKRRIANEPEVKVAMRSSVIVDKDNPAKIEGRLVDDEYEEYWDHFAGPPQHMERAK